MTRSKTPTLPLPAAFGAIRAGFELTTRAWWLIIVPLALDLLYWLGPRLRVAALFDRSLQEAVAAAGSAAALGLQPEALTRLTELVGGMNLVTLLSIPLWGVPALMSGATPTEIPVVAAAVEVADWGQFFSYYALLTAAGVLLSALYFGLVTRAVRGEAFAWGGVLRDWLPNALRLGAMLLTLAIVVLLMLFPIALIAVVAGAFGPALAAVVAVTGSILITWTVIFVTFGLQALFLQRLAPLAALLAGVRFLQQQVGAALPLLLIIFLINMFGVTLWRRADDGSWLTMISLVGHAFVATAMFVSLFVFYRDRMAVASAPPPVTVESEQQVI